MKNLAKRLQKISERIEEEFDPLTKIVYKGLSIVFVALEILEPIFLSTFTMSLICCKKMELIVSLYLKPQFILFFYGVFKWLTLLIMGDRRNLTYVCTIILGKETNYKIA